MIFAPKKSLGQNFLINKKIINEIVKLGKINSQSTVLEIGPGTGNLTDEILKNNPKKFTNRICPVQNEQTTSRQN